jgi:tetratricopeptide (TPR) repeat protein
MKFKTYIALVLFLLMGQSAQSCINEYRALLNGDVTFTDGFNAAPVARFDKSNKKYLLQQLDEAEKRYQKSRTIEDYSDYGSMLIYTGNYLKAKSIYLEIEKKSPGRYQTAANLGTTYELLGQNDSALYWIKKAVKIFPNSHNGSEWIHVKILEAKVKANGDENYLWTHSILSLDFGNEEIPKNKNKLNLIQLQNQLYFQLRERMSFIKPKDPVIAQLLFDLGNVTALTSDATSGLQVYRLAQEYGYSSELFTKRKEHFEDLQFWADFRNNTSQWMSDHKRLTVLIAVLVFIAGILVIRFLYKRIRKMVYKKRN